MNSSAQQQLNRMQNLSSAAKMVKVNGKWVKVEEVLKEETKTEEVEEEPKKSESAAAKAAAAVSRATTGQTRGKYTAQYNASKNPQAAAPVPTYTEGIAMTADEMELEKQLKLMVGFLSDSLCAGRATGTRGAVEASAYVARDFESAGLQKIGSSWYHSFAANGKVGRNVIGVRPGRKERYVLVMAYYDGLGTIGENMYPGADANASGVAALLSLAHMLPANNECGVIFAALDAHAASMAGARKACSELSNRNIALVMNLDILGSTMAPVSAAVKDFIMVLGGARYSKSLTTAAQGIGTRLYFDYYGSNNFTDLMYRRISDQKPFLDKGIPALMFTSGITMSTNKTTDTAGTLDFPVMTHRVELISRFLNNYVK